ncbi:MAG: hypothetical protein R3257_03850, partial [bacterium]|nr:hypothetical protein [bacterium]
RDHWPRELEQAQPELQKLSWWVRQNFESTYRAHHPERPPLVLDIQEADLSARVVPRSFQVDIPISGLSGALVSVGKEGSVRSELSIRDNEIPLTMRNLVNFEQIHVDGPYWLNFSPDRLSVGDYGILHFITGMTPGIYEDVVVESTDITWGVDQILINVLEGRSWFRSGRPLARLLSPHHNGIKGTFPLGRDDPSPIPDSLGVYQWRHDLTACCPQPWEAMELGGKGYFACLEENHPIPYCQPAEFADPVENPKLDFALEHHLPRELVEENCRLPEKYELNDLMGRILEITKKPKKERPDLIQAFLKLVTLKDPDRPASSLLELIEAGEVSFDLKDLRDLYILGIVDIGPSTGRFHLSYDSENKIQIQGEDIHLQLDPMDYPASSTGERGPHRIHGGQITTGTRYVDATGFEWKPGIQAKYDPESRVLEASINLRVQAEVTVPFLGKIQLEAPLLFKTKLNKRGGWRLDPGHTTFLSEKIRITRSNKRAPLDTSLSLVLSDEKGFEGTYYKETSSEHPHFNFSLTGPLGDKKSTSLALAGFIPVAQDVVGYQWEDFLNYFEWRTSLKIKGPQGTRNTSFIHLSTFKPFSPMIEGTENDLGIRLDLDVLDGERTWEEEEAILAKYKSDPDFVDRDWIVDRGYIQFSRVQNRDGKYENHLRAEAEELRFGPLVLQGVSAETIVDQVKIVDGFTKLTIPKFSISANPQGSSEGVVRGKIQAQLIPCVAEGGKQKNLCQFKEDQNLGQEDGILTVLWNQAERQLTFENLNLELGTQGIQIPQVLENLQKSQRTEKYLSGEKLRRRADAIGLDGRVKGHFDFNFEDWSGKGDLRILGDRDGDVYFHSKAGNRINPPLLKNTNWRFRRFDKFLFDRGYALGHFRLYTHANTHSLRKFGYSINYSPEIIMGHRDVMFKPGGIDEANLSYYRKLYRELLQRTGLEMLHGEV